MGHDDTIRMTLEGSHEIDQARQQLLSGDPIAVAGGGMVRRADGSLSPEIYVADPRSLRAFQRLIADLAPHAPTLHGVAIRRAWRLAGRPSSAWKIARLDLLLTVAGGSQRHVAFLFRLPRTLEAVRALAAGATVLTVADQPLAAGGRHRLTLPWPADDAVQTLLSRYEGRR